MGGIGSGRHWQFGASTTEDYRSIDVRRLKRDGLLSPGQTYNWRWLRDGDVVASIHIETMPSRIVLSYRHARDGENWQDERYPVYLSTSVCHFGGVRHWFICPALGCERRVAILYGGSIFACRHCYRLAYASQREKAADRAARRADRIRERLGWPGSFIEGGDWGKPKGMHLRTYKRLCQEHDDFSEHAWAQLKSHLLRLKNL